jgi:flagellar protein FlgJ
MAAPRYDASLAVDSRKLDSLKSAASKDPAGQAKEAAKQFEAVFANLLMKSMREAMPKSGFVGGGEGEKMFQGMLDQQRAQAFASKGGLGLAPVIEKQLLKHIQASMPKGAAGQATVAPAEAGSQPASGARFSRAAKYEIVRPDLAKTDAPAKTSTPETFVEKLKTHAAQAAKMIGVPTAFVLGQAALESGWGRREIGADQGVQSHNLFGIKAGANWKGATVDIPTTEYVDGVARTVTAKFRAYGSYAEAFADYAKLITGSSRYSAAANAGDNAQAFAQGLQKGGYATDPRYAEKLAATIARASRA